MLPREIGVKLAESGFHPPRAQWYADQSSSWTVGDHAEGFSAFVGRRRASLRTASSPKCHRGTPLAVPSAPDHRHMEQSEKNRDRRRLLSRQASAAAASPPAGLSAALAGAQPDRL